MKHEYGAGLDGGSIHKRHKGINSQQKIVNQTHVDIHMGRKKGNIGHWGMNTCLSRDVLANGNVWVAAPEPMFMHTDCQSFLGDWYLFGQVCFLGLTRNCSRDFDEWALGVHLCPLGLNRGSWLWKCLLVIFDQNPLHETVVCLLGARTCWQLRGMSGKHSLNCCMLARSERAQSSFSMF